MVKRQQLLSDYVKTTDEECRPVQNAPETQPEAVARYVYTEAAVLYNRLKSRLGPEADFHYEVLYGPPMESPPIFFLAFQPGGGATAASRSSIDRPADDPPWPLKSEYGDEKNYQYRLAKKLRAMFPLDLLARCTGCNALFIRSPSIDSYNGTVAKELRREIRDQCLPLVLKLVQAMTPKLLVVLGFETLKLFDLNPRVVLPGERRALVKEGVVHDRKALATLHPTGQHHPRLSASEIHQTGAFIMEKLRSMRSEAG